MTMIYTKSLEVHFHRSIGVEFIEKNFHFQILVNILVQSSQVDNHILKINYSVVLLVYRCKQLLDFVLIKNNLA